MTFKLDGGFQQYILTGLIVFNTVLGLIFIITGSIYYVSLDKYVELLIYNFKTTSSFTIAVGVIIFVITWIAFRFNQEKMKMPLILCNSILLISYISLLVVSVMEYLRVQDGTLKWNYLTQLDDLFQLAHFQDNYDVKNTFYVIQSEFECCGVTDIDDYRNKSIVPASCCFDCVCYDRFCQDYTVAWKDGCGIQLFNLIIEDVSKTTISSIVISTLGIIDVLIIPILALLEDK